MTEVTWYDLFLFTFYLKQGDPVEAAMIAGYYGA